MLRSSLFLASAALLCGTASAQQIDHSNYRIMNASKLRRPGTYVVRDQRWIRESDYAPGGLAGIPGTTTVFNNTCMWAGNAPNTISFIGVDGCTDLYAEGNIPSTTSPLDLSGLATNDNNIVGVQLGYATFVGPGLQSIEYSFWDNLGGTCVGFTSPTPANPVPQGQLNLNSTVAPVIPAPADPTLGSGTLWIFTIDLSGTGFEFCLQSDGDGTFSGFGSAADQFSYRFRHRNFASATGASGEGPLLAGDPMFVGAAGTLTYSTPGVPQLVTAFTQPCGTGRGTSDSFWLNSNTLAPCTTAGFTGCFGFGYPGAIFGSYYLSLRSDGICADPEFLTYCTAKTTSQGCIPFITPTGTGLPSVSDTGQFNIQGRDVTAGNGGILVYGFGKANLNFHGGKLCVKSPIRTAGKTAKSKAADVCTTVTSTGRLTTNFNNRIQGGLDPLLSVGAKVRSQWQQRDPANTIAGFSDCFTNGLQFVILP